MKKLFLILLLSVVFACGCGKEKKDLIKETLIYVFENSSYGNKPEKYEWDDFIETEKGYLSKIDSIVYDTSYYAYELNDFSYDGIMRYGRTIWLASGYSFATHNDSVYHIPFRGDYTYLIKYGITDSLFSFSYLDDELIFNQIIEHCSDDSFTISGIKYTLSYIKKQHD